MKLVRIALPAGHPAVGAVRTDGSVVLARNPGEQPHAVTLGDVLERGHLRDVLEKNLEIADADPGRLEDLLVQPEGVRLRTAVDRSALVVNIGTNYRAHDDELGVDPGDFSWFVKSRHALAAHGDPIVIPSHLPDRVDYEGELCVVFAQSCHRVAAEDALDHVGGYTLMNDVSARDAWPAIAAAGTPLEGREAWSQMLLGKQLPSFGPTGPAVVTSEEIADLDSLHLTTRLNGAVVQDAAISTMKFAIPELVARLSQYFSFRPGDAISTGTPSGVGQGRSPQRFLRPGDEVSVSVPGIGMLSNSVIAGGSHE